MALYILRLGAVLYFVVDTVPSSPIVTYMLLATFFSASLTSCCLHDSIRYVRGVWMSNSIRFSRVLNKRVLITA